MHLFLDASAKPYFCPLNWCEVQFNRAKLPERTVHARGFAAKGHFEVTFNLQLKQAVLLFIAMISLQHLLIVAEASVLLPQVTKDMLC